MFEFVTLNRDPSPSRRRSSFGGKNSSSNAVSSEYAASAVTAQVKISIMGSEKVGKTTLLNHYIHKQHRKTMGNTSMDEESAPESTVYDFSYATVTMNVNGGQRRNGSSSNNFSSSFDSTQQHSKAFCLYFSECSARTEYAELRQISYEQTDIFIVCFRLDDERSFVEAIDTWMSEAKYAACHAAHNNMTNNSHRSRLVLLGLRFVDHTADTTQTLLSESELYSSEHELPKTLEEKDHLLSQRRISLELSPSLTDVIDIKTEQTEQPCKSNAIRPRLKSYSARKSCSQPVCCSSFNEKRRGCTVHLNNLKSVGGCLNYTFMAHDSNRKVSWGMIEQGRKELLNRGIDHVYYECCATNQGNVQFVIEECVREYYNQLVVNAQTHSKRFSNRVSL
ncbi:hypothetical protein C9374_011088 [Naegleria lovaniensis]|uniref:Uncharacterized protein n=1 Tax=Naegleria lovaniensis TaxID=51637 RepID=A0AA88GHJ9_NAELO|nr:uncharacterized protein C9374_011088 [Naegleria lovaniensis]KAG2374251.1 hypothetical protein C9374_011088 [Naegleria lovaniensis]